MATEFTGGMMPQMRKLALVLVITACTAAPSPSPAPAPVQPAAPEVHGFTVEEEARVLRMEDRRDYDAAFIEAWTHHANPLHRARMALALGRVGPHIAARQEVIGQLVALVGDEDPKGRETAAFALGQSGAGADTLVKLAGDANGEVAAEAVEALSKLAQKIPLAQYSPFTNA